MSNPTTLINGQAIDHLSSNDRGLAYGDGLFETIAIADGQPCLWQRHLNRLLRGCDSLGIIFDDIPELEKEVFELAQQQKLDGAIKIIITRGNSLSGYRIESSAKPTRIVQLQERQTFSEDLYRQGINARFCKQPLIDNPALSKIKHLCRLEQVLARMEWQDEVHEGIMFDYQNNAIEGTMSNLFILEGAELKTPNLDNCGIQGVMREWILEQCEHQHIKVEETKLDRQRVLEADGLFFCNALIRIWPVRNLVAHHYDVDIVHQLVQRFEFSELGVRL